MIGLETRRTVTKLTFENHTACECVGRNSDVMPRTEPVLTENRRPLDDLRSYHDDDDDDDEMNRENSGRQSGSKSGSKRRSHGVHHALGRVATAYSSPLHRSRQHSLDSSPQQSAAANSTSKYAITCRYAHHHLHFLFFPLRVDSSFVSIIFLIANSRCRCPSGYSPSGGKKRTTCVCQCRNRHGNNRHRCSRLKRGLDIFPQRDRGYDIDTLSLSLSRSLTLSHAIDFDINIQTGVS